MLTSSREGSPNVVKEALACNLPVVSVDVGDVRERLAGIESCLVCYTDDPGAIAAALEQVLARSIESSSRALVEPLSLGAAAQRIIAVYQKVLDQN